MAINKRSKRNSEMDEEQKKLLKVLTIPLIVLILILVIVIADRPKNDSKEESVTVTQASTETMAPTTPAESESTTEETTTEPVPTEPVDPYEAEDFKRNTDPAIEELMQNYFKARKTADAELMNRLYGIEGLAEWQLEAERVRLWTNAKYMTDFTNITVYVKDGLNSDSWLVYTTTDMKFRMVKTTAPMIMYCYVTKDAEGTYTLMDNNNFTTDITNYIDEANRSDAVRKLAADVNRSLQEALSADEELRSVYGILHSNSPVWGDEYQESMAEVRILTEEELEARSANETEAETTEAASESEAIAETSAEIQPETSIEQ